MSQKIIEVNSLDLSIDVIVIKKASHRFPCEAFLDTKAHHRIR